MVAEPSAMNGTARAIDICASSWHQHWPEQHQRQWMPVMQCKRKQEVCDMVTARISGGPAVPSDSVRTDSISTTAISRPAPRKPSG